MPQFGKQVLGAREFGLPGGVRMLSGSGAPTDGTAGTGAGTAAPTSTYYDYTNKRTYQNLGTKASPAWAQQWEVSNASVTISKANILAMFTTPVTVVAAPAAGYALEFIKALLIFDYATAAYGGGGAVTLKYDSGATLTDTIAAANSFAASADKMYQFGRLDPTGGISIPAATAIQITNATGVFTDPGTAAGVGRLKITYRIFPTGL